MIGECEYLISDCSCAIDCNAIPETDCIVCRGRYTGKHKCYCGDQIIRDTADWWICRSCGPVNRLSPQGTVKE